MPFTTTPEQSTYKTKRFPLIGTMQQRSGTSLKDQRYINMFPEILKAEKKGFLKKRPGTITYFDHAVHGEGRGTYVTVDGNHIFSAVGSTIYRDNVAVITMTTSTGTVGFAEGDGPYNYLFICDGVSAWIVKTDGTVTAVSAGYPTPHIPQPLFIDGYILLAKKDTSDIYNSNLDNPLTWTAGEFITAEMFPDTIQGLAQANNYVLAFGRAAIEFFYDAANATGSPFARQANAVQQVGCIAPDTIVQTEKEAVFVGTTKNGGKTVWLIEGFKSKEIGTPQISQAITDEGYALLTSHALLVRVQGRKFYVLNLTSRTLVYDFDEELWHEWQYNGGAFPFNFSAEAGDSTVFVQDKTTGFMAQLVEYAYQDTTPTTTYPITCSAITAKIDFESFNRKACHRFTLLGDVPNDAAPTTAYISWSDDDYKSFSNEVPLSFNNDSATISQLGSFRRRAFKIRFTDNYPFRLEGFEIDVNIGQQ